MSVITCDEVEAKMVDYLDQTVDSQERLLMEGHLSGCEACRRQLAGIIAVRKNAARALQSLAKRAEPPAQAWDLLQVRLEREAHRAPAFDRKVWNARKAPRAGRASIWNTLIGGFRMQKRTVFSGITVFIVLAAVGVYLFGQASPVSARQIIDKAYRANSAQQATEGIRHMVIENYTNQKIMGAGNWAETIISESYVDLSTGIYRNISMDAESGTILSASSFDGSYMYTNREYESQEKRAGGLILYRTPQGLDKIAGLMPSAGPIDAKAIFESMEKQADEAKVTTETRSDGRKVYVLRSKIAEGAGEKFGIADLNGESIAVVDSETYDLLETSTVMREKDGNETILSSFRILKNEILPAGSVVSWDLSDMAGITFVDDPERIYGDLLPEKITPEELAGHTSTGYLLESVPEGFNLELSAPPQQTNESEYFWMAAYRNADGDYLMLQSGGPHHAAVFSDTAEVYRTKSGLELRIEVYEQGLAEGMKPDLAVFISAPDGVEFMLTSNLPLERVLELAEGLDNVK